MQIPNDVAYCLYCGVKANTPQNAKSIRTAFFLIPGFIILICLGLTYDLGSTNYFDIGITLSGYIISIYFFGALLFGSFKLFFKIPTIPGSFLSASLTSSINIITSTIASFSIQSLFLSEFFEKLGPTYILKYQLILLFGIFITIQTLETIAISLKAKVKKNPEIADTFSKQIIFNYLYLEIPIDFIILAAICFYFVQPPEKTAFWVETLTSLSAKEKAETQINKGLEKFPDNAKLCYLKSNLLSESDQLFTSFKINDNNQQALILAKKAAELKPDSPFYKYYLSLQFEINKDYSNAIYSASQAASLAQNDSLLWMHLGNINLKHKNYSNSIDAYKKALTIEPNNAIAMNNLSYTLLTKNQDCEIALKLAQEAVKLMPNSIANRDTLAWAYYKCKKYTEALDEISILYNNDIIDISPEIDFHYAAILDEMGLLKNPIETYDKMIVKPEIVTDQDLLNQIIDARIKAENKRKGNQ